jgi:1-acyl-sn-glycerol-3-phosphate acyltransferase
MAGTVKDANLGFAARALRVFARAMVAVVQRPKLYGPKPALDEPTIFACRHVGLMDPVILMTRYPDMMIRPLAATDYFDANRFTKAFFTTAQAIPIDRTGKDKQWLEDAKAAIAKGESIIIFPEGKRNKSGSGLLPFHVGVAVLAAESGARIIPVYNRFWKFPHRYELAIGEPMHIDSTPPDGIISPWLHAQADKVRDAMGELEKRF